MLLRPKNREMYTYMLACRPSVNKLPASLIALLLRTPQETGESSPYTVRLCSLAESAHEEHGTQHEHDYALQAHLHF
jgi:hypothetical protein